MHPPPYVRPISSRPLPNHPSYTEMIRAAIMWDNLQSKQENGSSKTCIENYIYRVYSNYLPPTHTALLSYHLNQLTDSGQLVLINDSYHFPPFFPASPRAQAQSQAQPEQPRDHGQLVSGPNGKRPRGRPWKKAIVLYTGVENYQAQAQARLRRSVGRPRKSVLNPVAGNGASALGKRPKQKNQRPDKVVVPISVVVPVDESVNPGVSNNQVREVERVGTNRLKPQPDYRDVMGNGAEVLNGVSSSGKRPVGRPRKENNLQAQTHLEVPVSSTRPLMVNGWTHLYSKANQQPQDQVQLHRLVSIPIQAPVLSPAVVHGSNSGKRPRGRPPKEKNQRPDKVVVPISVVVPVDESVNPGVSDNQVPEVERVGPDVLKPQPDYRDVMGNGAEVLNGVSSSGKRPVGRPRKENNLQAQAHLEVPVSSTRPLMVNGWTRLYSKSNQQPQAQVQLHRLISISIPIQAPVLSPVVVHGSNSGKRPRGRPPKEKNQQPDVVVPISVVGQTEEFINSGVSNGQVQKVERVGPDMVKPQPDYRDVSVNGEGLVQRGQGKWLSVKRVYTGKPRGRPRRNFTFGKHTSWQGQMTANKDLLMKLEDMQSKLRDTVRVIRPHLAYQNSPDALTALQQLEELSTRLSSTPSSAPIAT